MQAKIVRDRMAREQAMRFMGTPLIYYNQIDSFFMHGFK